MIILGIDPGLNRTGYAVLEQTSKQIKLKVCGCIITPPGETQARRLLEIKQDLTTLIKKWQPDTVVVESLFFETNVKTAMSVSQARGVILVTVAEQKIKLIEVTPLQVKISTTGYGKADKAQVQRMIVKLLNLKKVPKPDDAADACAIAWSGIGRIKFEK